MKSSAKKVELASVDDLFSTEESRADAQRERVLEIPLSELHPFKNHPFKVKDDESMMETADSVRQYGVLVPAIARPDPEGGYELVAGHRRHRASELAEKETMPVIVRELDDDAATIIMVDSNLQRESPVLSDRGQHFIKHPAFKSFRRGQLAVNDQAVHIAFWDKKHFHHLYCGGSIGLFSCLDPYGTFCSTPCMVADSLSGIGISQRSSYICTAKQYLVVLLKSADTAKLRVFENFHLVHSVTSCKSRCCGMKKDGLTSRLRSYRD